MNKDKDKNKNKNAKKKPMFMVKETLVHLTSDQMGQVQGGALGSYYCCRHYSE